MAINFAPVLQRIKATQRLLDISSTRISTGNQASRPSDDALAFATQINVQTRISENGARLNTLDAQMVTLSATEIQINQLKEELTQLNNTVVQGTGPAINKTDLASLGAAFKIQAAGVYKQLDNVLKFPGMETLAPIKEYVDTVGEAFATEDKSKLTAASVGLNKGADLTTAIIGRLSIKQIKIENEKELLTQKDLGNYLEYQRVADSDYTTEAIKNQTLSIQIQAAYAAIAKLSKLTYVNTTRR